MTGAFLLWEEKRYFNTYHRYCCIPTPKNVIYCKTSICSYKFIIAKIAKALLSQKYNQKLARFMQQNIAFVSENLAILYTL